MPAGEATGCQLFARVVHEDTGEAVLRWQACNTNEDRTWSVVLREVPVGGLYRIETCLNCSGQTIEWSSGGDMRHWMTRA